MPEINFFIEIVKNVGFPAILYIMWYFYHKATVEMLQKNSNNQFENSNHQFQMMEKNSNNQFEILKSLLESNNSFISALARIENKIDTNQMCPLMREKRKE